MKLLLAVLALMSVPAMAQPARATQAPEAAPATSAVATPPALTDTETLALQSVQAEFTRAQQDLIKIERDLVREHPGFHLNEQTLTLVPNMQPAMPKPAIVPPLAKK